MNFLLLNSLEDQRPHRQFFASDDINSLTLKFCRKAKNRKKDGKMDAIQLNDMLTGGFVNGLNSIRERNQERAEIMLENSLLTQRNQWIAYSEKLERTIDAQSIRISVLQKDYAGLKKSLTNGRNLDTILIESYLDKITRRQERLIRQSADAHSLALMRDRLVEELTEIATSPTPLMDPAAMLALHQSDWEEYLETSVPPAYKHVRSKRFA